MGTKTAIKITAIKGKIVNATRDEKITEGSTGSALKHILGVILECKLRHTQRL